MPGRKIPVPRDFSPRALLTAGAIMAVAVAARAALDQVLPQTPPFVTLYPAVAIAGTFCGPLAGAASGLIGVAAAMFLWIPPRMSFGVESRTDAVALVVFVAASSVMLWATAVLRARLDAAAFAKSALDLGLAAGGVGTWEINLRTGRITASSGARRLHGLPDDASPTTSEDWLRGIPPEDAAAATAALRAAIVDGSLASYTYRVTGAADGPRSVVARGRVLSAGGERRLLSAGGERRLLCALVDVTEQIRAEDELRRERERLRLALEAGSLAVWDYDLATGEARIDTRYAATLGFAPDIGTVTRAQIGERIHPQDRPRVAAEHQAAIARGHGYHIEYRIVTPPGEIRWLMSQGILIQDGAPGCTAGMIGIIQDITDRKRREEDLRALAMARELLVREADHRIKNSLQLVISLLTVQLRGVTDPAAADALRGAITRVGAIAASHLALQGSEDLRHVDLAVTLRELCAHLGQLHPAIAIVCRSDEALMLDADRAIPLGLAVSEVVTNALRHAFPGRAAGTVTVEAATIAGELVVRISDDGVGMPPRDGTAGLGSRIIRSFAARIAATVDVQSAPRAGTVVTLRLKLAAEEARQRQAG